MTRSILQTADYDAPYDGTFVAMLRAIGREGERHGYRSVWLLPEKARQWPWYAQLTAAGQAIRLLPRSASLRQYTREIAGIATEEDAAILHTHFTTYDIAAWAASRLLRVRGKRIGVVWHAHSEIRDRQGLFRRLKDLVKYRMLGASVRAIACSEGVLGDLRAAGVPAKNARLAINGIDIELSTAARRPPAEVRAELGVPAGEKMLFMFAWAPLRKGLDVAIDAVEKLNQEGHGLWLVPSGTEEMQTFISQRMQDKPLPWLRPVGKVPNVADLYQASSLFLCPSRSEGLAAAVLEALANRLPLVHSDIPAAQWAREVPNVVFCAPGDSASLAAAIRTALAWPAEKLAERTSAGFDIVRKQFDVNVWAKRCFQVYKELLD